MKAYEGLTEAQIKRRKLLLVLPLLMLPFMTLAFWALGGGQRKADFGQQTQTHKGINSAVPPASNLANPEDKMSLYAEADRLAETEMDKKKPLLDGFSYLDGTDSAALQSSGLSFLDEVGEGGFVDSNSAKAEEKLADLKTIMEQVRRTDKAGGTALQPINPATYGLQPGEESPEQQEMPTAGTAGSKQDLNQLNHLNRMIEQAAGPGEREDGAMDSETRQINTMLDKILMIQHPEKTADSLKTLSGKNKGIAYAVRHLEQDVRVPLLLPPVSVGSSDIVNESRMPACLNADAAVPDSLGHHPQQYINDVKGAFYDIEPAAREENANYTLQAVIAETQTLTSGGTVKMRLTEALFIDGMLIPEGSFVFGSCTLTGERLKVEIHSIRYKERLIPVALSVYDLDGIEGICMPGGIGRDAAKQGADRALSGVQMMSLDPSVSAQAATAGIEAAKGLLSKKVKLIRVTVKSGYPVLLVDGKRLRQGNR